MYSMYTIHVSNVYVERSRASLFSSEFSGHRMPVSEAVPVFGPTRSVRERHATPFLNEEKRMFVRCLLLCCASKAVHLFSIRLRAPATSIGPPSLFERVRRQDVTRQKPLSQESHGPASRSSTLQRTSGGSSSAMTSAPRHPALCSVDSVAVM